MRTLDKTDQQILAILEENGRATYVEVSKMVGLSQTPCAERIRRLEQDGFISGYTAKVDPELVQRGFMVFIQVTFTDSTNETFNTFNEKIKDIKEITECYMVAGGFDCLLKIRIKDMADFRQLLIDKLAEIPGIAQTNSFAVIEELKNTQSLIA
jgi:Lrp/AsnC family leucine-responsive transcriptional regulator